MAAGARRPHDFAGARPPGFCRFFCSRQPARSLLHLWSELTTMRESAAPVSLGKLPGSLKFL